MLYVNTLLLLLLYILFTMYLVPLGDIVRSHGVTFHAYADDCQLYIAFSRENVSMTKYKMETLLAEIKQC